MTTGAALKGAIPPVVFLFPRRRSSARARTAHDRERMLFVQRACNGDVNGAIRRGEIRRANACEVCADSDALVVAHHHDYAEPLSVTWLCVTCHRRWHVEFKGLVRAMPFGDQMKLATRVRREVSRRVRALDAFAFERRKVS